MPTTASKALARSRRLLVQYDISAEDYEKILECQGGGCAICHRPPVNIRLAVDHDHRTGVTRGLLCKECNKAVGYLRDSADRALNAAEYLAAPPATTALGRVPVGRLGRASRRFRGKERRLRLAQLAPRLEALRKGIQ